MVLQLAIFSDKYTGYAMDSFRMKSNSKRTGRFNQANNTTVFIKNGCAQGVNFCSVNYVNGLFCVADAAAQCLCKAFAQHSVRIAYASFNSKQTTCGNISGHRENCERLQRDVKILVGTETSGSLR